MLRYKGLLDFKVEQSRLAILVSNMGELIVPCAQREARLLISLRISRAVKHGKGTMSHE
jgi:hypothetical protein